MNICDEYQLKTDHNLFRHWWKHRKLVLTNLTMYGAEFMYGRRSMTIVLSFSLMFNF